MVGDLHGQYHDLLTMWVLLNCLAAAPLLGSLTPQPTSMQGHRQGCRPPRSRCSVVLLQG